MTSDTLGPGGRQLSVMIPTYNSSDFLATTLRSLCGQGLDQAQIEVVDDASSDDPEAVVTAAGPRGTTFHRHDRNIGMVANFNACIQRAQRRWVHILHGDDAMLPGAYESFGRLLSAFPHCRAGFARVVSIDEQGRWRGTSPVLGEGMGGELVYATTRWGLTPVQFAGVVFQRAAADDVGRFDQTLSHTADWDLWWRMARRFPVAYSNECLGAYREFEGNHSSKLRRGAGNLRQGLEQVNRIAAADGRGDRAVYWPLFDHAVQQARSLSADRRSLLAHVKVLASFPPVVPRGRAIARMVVAHGVDRVSRWGP